MVDGACKISSINKSINQSDQSALSLSGSLAGVSVQSGNLVAEKVALRIDMDL